MNQIDLNYKQKFFIEWRILTNIVFWYSYKTCLLCECDALSSDRALSGSTKSEAANRRGATGGGGGGGKMPPPPMIFFFLLVSSAVGHGHDNTPYTTLGNKYWKHFWSRGKNVSESDFLRAGAYFLGSRSPSETFCSPPPPPSKHPGATPGFKHYVWARKIWEKSFFSQDKKVSWF